MIQGHLLRLGLILAGSMIAKFFAVRWVGANFDLKRAIDNLGVELKNLAKDIGEKGSKFTDDLDRLVKDFGSIQDGQDVDLEELLAMCNRTLVTYRALPTPAKALVRTTLDIEGHVRDVAKSAVEQEGWRLIGAKADPNGDLTEHLSGQYRGLYYLGCVGRRLSADEADQLAKTLIHFHAQLGRATDAPLVEWYQTVGVSQKTKLVDLLRICPEVADADLSAERIAWVMAQNVDVEPVDVLTVFQ